MRDWSSEPRVATEGPRRYRKRPVVIEALRWDGRSIEAVLAFTATAAPLESDRDVDPGIGHIPATGELDIPTLEGHHTARPGDWIIRGVRGELYPCKPDIFEATYEPVDDEHAVKAATQDPSPPLRELDLGDWNHVRVLLLEVVKRLQADGQPRSRERALAITKLQEAGMWAGEAMMREMQEE